jgi:hypothetical protein
MKLTKTWLGALAFTIGSLSLAGCGSSDSTVQNDDLPKGIDTDSDCFWVGPYVKENPASNIAYPDTGATYWHAGYTLPEGASLKLNGEFPYARYMSLNSYRGDASPAYAMVDKTIKPDDGSINPFIQDANRHSEYRHYQLNIKPGTAPQNIESNTLYDAVGNTEKAVLVYRVYVPNEGKDIQGGVVLPQAELTLASGEVLSGIAACDALKSDTKLLPIPKVPAQTYGALRQFNPAQNSLIDDGNTQTVKWKAAYNAVYTNRCSFLGKCEANPERQVNWYANLDNQYVSAFLDNSIKPVVVMRGKLPKIPATLAGVETFDESNAQLRYWSICQNEYYSQKVTACLYDEQITIQPDGEYLVVTSTLENKPNNVSSECGIDYLPWSEAGDGFGIVEGMQNNIHDALILVRNMLPINNFDQAVQNTQTPGDELSVMGDYLPTAQYFTKAEFEALGCDAYSSL